jgi:methionine synthase I (cobalamin-dependent)/5,10-methylenetetrahydrofolate reductase
VTGFSDVLGTRLLLCDGAMGTMLHAAGAALDRALPEVNLTNPRLVATIHESYLSAGADVIETNTFGANRLWLAEHGQEDKAAEINRSAVRIAREAAERSGRQVFVAGAVSPAVTARQRRQVGAAERMAVLREQVQALAEAGVDLLIMETFGYLDELAEAVTVAGDICGVPVVAQATFADDGRTLGGETPREVATVLGELPAAVIGTNCTIGPQRMLAVVEDLVRYSPVPVSAQPNAGQPRRVARRRFEFTIDSSYFARYLRRFAEAGAVLVGGCCGTTPTHIRAAAASLADLPAAGAPAAARAQPRRAVPEQAGVTPGMLATRLASRSFVVAAEITAPDGGSVSQATDAVTALRDEGVGLFAVTAPPSPRAHLDSLGLALHLQQDAGVETMVTMSTWDKTIMTLQADLLGAHALGIRSVICETGSPLVLGDYPAVDGIWEVDSLGLISLLAGLNAGRDSDGLPLTTKTSFSIGTRINPGAADTAAEIARVRAEIRAGAQFIVTRPAYELDALRLMAGSLADEHVPILLTVTPLRSFEEADYLAHEVPEVNIPGSTLAAMERAGRRSARGTGLDLAVALLREARSLVDGVVVAMTEGDLAAARALLAAAAS